jgi:hypothetical protein
MKKRAISAVTISAAAIAGAYLSHVSAAAGVGVNEHMDMRERWG